MSSLNAQLVAQKVSENIRIGKKVVLGEIIRNSGYSRETSLKPKLVTDTKSYKMAIIPVIDSMESQIQRINEAIANRDLSKEEYRTLVGALDIYIKNYQLLSGRSTSREILVLPSEVMEKNNIGISRDLVNE